MKWVTTEQKQSIVVYSIVICIGILFYFLIKNLQIWFSGISAFINIIAPIIYGFVLSYLLSGPVKFFEDKIFVFKCKNKRYHQFKRAMAILLSYIVSIIAIAALFAIVIPQIANSLMSLFYNASGYLASAESEIILFIDKLNLDPDIMNSIDKAIKDFTLQISGFITSIVPKVLEYLLSITLGLADAVLSVIISIYLLANKELFYAQTKKILNAFLPDEFIAHAVEITRKTNKVFNGFIVGKMLDSLIVGIICGVFTVVFKFPFAILVSVIVGVTNIIPYFGPFIGAIPSLIIIFIVSPIHALWFSIFILALQQFDGNVLGPKILGDSTGLTAFWVIFAILVGTGLFGIVGMIISVPTFAVIYSIIKSVVLYMLHKKGKPTSTSDYASESHPLR